MSKPALDAAMVLEQERVKRIYTGSTNSNQITPLRKAIMEGDLDQINQWLGIKEIQDYIEAENHKILGIAAYYGQLAIFKRLLEIKAVKDTVANENNRVLVAAIEKGHLDIAKELLEIEAVRMSAAGASNQILWIAAYHGRAEIVKELLNIKAVKDAAAAENNRALMAAATQGHSTVVQQLLEIETVRNSAAVNNNHILNQRLLGARHNGHIDIVKQLLKIKAVRETVAENDNQILWTAAQSGDLASVDLLLEIKTVWDAVSKNSNKILGAAAFNGYPDIVDRLLKIKAVRDTVAVQDNKILKVVISGENKEKLTCEKQLRRIDIIKRLLKENFVRYQLIATGHLETFERQPLGLLHVASNTNDLHVLYLLINVYYEMNVPTDFQDILIELNQKTFNLNAIKNEVQAIQTVAKTYLKRDPSNIVFQYASLPTLPLSKRAMKNISDKLKNASLIASASAKNENTTVISSGSAGAPALSAGSTT